MKLRRFTSAGVEMARQYLAACHASGLPTPVFEYHGSAFVVTILKDAWTRTALESLDLNPDQIKAVSYVKVNGWISSSRYAELYKVPMRTSSRELGELAHKGVLVLVGKGRQSRYELKSNRARIAPIAPNVEQQTKPQKNKGKFKANHSLSPQTTQITTIELSPEMASQVSPQNISDGAACVLALIKSNDQIRTHEIALELGVSKRTVLRYIKGLSVVGLRHEGPTKKGRWVFGPKSKGKRGTK
jgi:predicted HTH transcriptional regulator